MITTLSPKSKGQERFFGTAKTIGNFAWSNIAEGSVIQSDAYHSFRKPLSEKNQHLYQVFDPEGEMLRWVHIIIGNAKAFITGTFHGLDQKYLQRYLDEVCYRFSRHFQTGVFSNLLVAVTSAQAIPLAEIKG